MLFKTVGILAAVAFAQDTDTTFSAQDANEIDVSDVAGEVVVRAWDRDEIRIQARHGRRTEIRIRRRRGAVRVSSEGRYAQRMADVEITVPRGLGVSMDGMFSSLDVEDVGGPVSAETVQGALRVTGAEGAVTLTSIQGPISVARSSGIIRISVVSGNAEVSGVDGEIVVEAIAGSVSLSNMTASKAEVGTVGGSVRYEGRIAPGGEYWLSSHSGSVTLEVPADTDADVWSATVSGRIHIRMTDENESLGRGTHEFTLGSGGADIELESFSGSVTIRTPRRDPS